MTTTATPAKTAAAPLPHKATRKRTVRPGTQVAPPVATKPTADQPTIDVGGVQATVEQVKAALDTLTSSKGIMVKQPLRAAHNPLSEMDYHAVAKVEFDLDPELRKAAGPTKAAVVRALGKVVDSPPASA